jgi:hypothetical protein
MLKPLTFSVSLAVALGTCSLGMAGHGKSLPSAQCEGPSAQCATPSPQGCGDVCGPVAKKCNLFSGLKHKPKCVEYEWVLKKKHHNPFKGLFGHKGGCGGDICGGCGETYASGQCPSPQAAVYGSGQGGTWGSGQVGGSGQIAPAGQATPAAGDSGGTPPEPPAASTPTASNGSLLFLAPAGN